jgi:uncharacterized membrane protein (UPF0127 family)
MLRVLSVLLLLLSMSGCDTKSQSVDDFQSQPLTLPGGQQIRVELMRLREDMMRGMMFRKSLAPDRGMLFVHGSPGLYPYWMYQVLIPLDILWLDLDRRVVEIAANTPPCPSASAKECPYFGGHKMAVYVLELPGGAAGRFGIRVGDRVKF